MPINFPIIDRVIRRFGYVGRPEYEKLEQRVNDSKQLIIGEIAQGIGYDMKRYASWMESYWNPNPIHHTAQWKGYSIYLEMDCDAKIYNCMSTRKEALLSRPVVVESAKPGDPYEDKKAALIWWNLEHVPQLIQKKREVLSDKDYGFSVSEKVFGYEDVIIPPDGKRRKNSITITNALVLKDIKTKVPSAFGFDGLGNLCMVPNTRIADNLGYGIYLGGFNATPLSPAEAQHFLVLTHDPRFGSRYGMPLKTAFFWDYITKKATKIFRQIYAQKYGSPVVKGTYPRDATDPEVNKFHDRLKTWQNNNTIVHPEGFAVDLVTAAAQSASMDIFQNILDHADGNISEVALGHRQATTSGDDASPFGTTDAKSGLRQDKLEMDGVALDTAWNDEIVPLIIDGNFTPNGLYPKVKTITEPEADLDKYIFRVQALYNMKVPQSVRQIREKTGQYEPDEDDQLLLEPEKAEKGAVPIEKQNGNGTNGQNSEVFDQIQEMKSEFTKVKQAQSLEQWERAVQERIEKQMAQMNDRIALAITTKRKVVKDVIRDPQNNITQVIEREVE